MAEAIMGTVKADADESELERWRGMRRHTERVEKILKIAGSQNKPICLADTLSSWREFFDLDALIEDEGANISIVIPQLKDHPFQASAPQSILFIRDFPVGSGCIYYCARGVMNQDRENRFIVDDISIVNVSHSKRRMKSLRDYSARMKSQTRITNVLGPAGKF
ncbi:MAG: hypothetical protein ACK4RV_09050 [Caulobacter sp.]